MLDSKGPEIRIRTKDNKTLTLDKDAEIKLVCQESLKEEHAIHLLPSHVVEELEEGMKVLFDDGYIEGVVVKKEKGCARVKILNPGQLKSFKKINIPHGGITLPAMSEQDIEDFVFGCEQDIDMIAASFIQSADNVLEIRKLLKKHGKADIIIISKIESVSGVKNFESILQVSDGIMVARGDLGVELPLKEVPQLQKMMIRKCNQEGKVVVTATQMLESMMINPRPTRAEVSDVANAIYDSTSCVMLSGETAAGKYPIECCSMMKAIVEEAEKDFDYEAYAQAYYGRNYKDASSSIALATVQTARKSLGHAIFTYTSSGFTPKVLSKFRPKIPILSLTQAEKIYHQLSVYWGVVPVLSQYENLQQAFDAVACFALKHKYVHYGDRVFVTAGTPFEVRGTTNMMLIKNIGDVLARGESCQGKYVYGEVIHGLCLDRDLETARKIVIITHCENKYEDKLKNAAGIILQNNEEDIASEQALHEIAFKYNISYITRAESAVNLVKEGEYVTLAPNKGVVFRGEVSKEEDIIAAVCSKNGCKYL
jgi:pyruvate kinase